MAKSDLFEVTSQTLSVNSGNLAAFSTSDFTQLVIQVTTVTSSGLTLSLQVSPDGTNWFTQNITVDGTVATGIVPSSGSAAGTGVADVAFGQARLHWANAVSGDTVTARVLGRF